MTALLSGAARDGGGETFLVVVGLRDVVDAGGETIFHLGSESAGWSLSLMMWTLSSKSVLSDESRIKLDVSGVKGEGLVERGTGEIAAAGGEARLVGGELLCFLGKGIGGCLLNFETRAGLLCVGCEDLRSRTISFGLLTCTTLALTASLCS